MSASESIALYDAPERAGTELALKSGSSIVAVDEPELISRLEAAGVRPRPLPSGVPSAVEDGVYYDRSPDRIIVWAPPDPTDSDYQSQRFPTAIELRMTTAGEGQRLDVAPTRLKPYRRLSSFFVLLNIAGLVWAFALDSGILWLFLFGLTCSLGGSKKPAPERERLAWSVVAPIVGALPKPETEIAPYR